MRCPGTHDETNPPVARRWHELGDLPGVCRDCALSLPPVGSVIEQARKAQIAHDRRIPVQLELD